MKDVIAALQDFLGADQVASGKGLEAYRRSWRDDSPLRALARVRPRSTEEVSGVLRICHAANQPVVTHGGVTGFSDGDLSTDEDVVVSLERMCKIEDIDAAGRTVTAEAGCTLQAVQDAVAAHGVYLPLDFGGRGSCTIGGNVSTNAGGRNVIRYGMARSQVLGLEAVLADGTVVSSMNRMLKNNSGYDLKQLFIGSEGTLGIVTRVVFALEEQSRSVDTALVAFSDGNAMAPFLKHMDQCLGGMLTSYEVMWGNYYQTSTAPGFYRPPLSRGYPFYAIVEARGPDPIADSTRFEKAIAEGFDSSLVVDAVIAKSEHERAEIWNIREQFLAGRSLKPKFVYDVGLPIKDMLEYIEEVRALLAHSLRSSVLFVIGHMGDGNLHLIVAPGEDSAALSLEQAHQISDQCVYAPLQRIGGAVSAEHGIGLQKKRWLPFSRNEAEIELMRALKRALDPRAILNRGKVVDI